jgi:hypothetical protein
MFVNNTREWILKRKRKKNVFICVKMNFSLTDIAEIKLIK